MGYYHFSSVCLNVFLGMLVIRSTSLRLFLIQILVREQKQVDADVSSNVFSFFGHSLQPGFFAVSHQNQKYLGLHPSELIIILDSYS